jgi:hypothetical protein
MPPSSLPLAHLWRLLAADTETGFVTSGLAFSSDALAWFPVPATPAYVPSVTTAAVMTAFDYANVSNASSPAACTAACATDSASCAAWSFSGSDCQLMRDVSVPMPAGASAACGLCPGLYGPLPVLPPLFAPPPNTDAPNYRQTYPKSLVLVQDRLLIHAAASQTVHGQSAPNTSATLVWSLRVDGFVALTTPPVSSSSLAVTKAVVWLGGDVLINVDCSVGTAASVTVAVLDPATGLPIDGFAPSDAVPLSGPGGDELRWSPAWTSGRTLNELAGQRLAFSIELTGGARVYALRGAFTAA